MDGSNEMQENAFQHMEKNQALAVVYVDSGEMQGEVVLTIIRIIR